jgi:Raf kinase inhibitor-like YbhB/YbcL family protein
VVGWEERAMRRCLAPEVRHLGIAVLLSLGASLVACGNATESLSVDPTSIETRTEGEHMAFEIISPEFDHQSAIPEMYTCDGDNVSPPLEWSGAPENTRSLALICDDPDAPAKTWVHWVIYDIPPDTYELHEAMDDLRELAFGARQGTNDFKNLGYGGPCPPPGDPHHYSFRLYALDKKVGLEPGTTKVELLHAMEGHILDQSELVGTYQRH